jgi:nicotinamide/nicotinate riboside kinase
MSERSLGQVPKLFSLVVFLPSSRSMGSSTTLVGLSGPSCSGKTTIARILGSIFPEAIVIHEDDFYRPEDQLPLRDGVVNWDCAAAVDVAAFQSALKYVKEYGRLPDTLISKEDKNAVGQSDVTTADIAASKDRVRDWAQREGWMEEGKRLAIVDGFLLFGESVGAIRAELDVRIMLRAKFEDVKRRREARVGYVTLEGFWEDPPGYVEKVVWPEYVEEHGFIFKGGDADGEVDEEVASRLGIIVCPGDGAWKVSRALDWTVDVLVQALGKGR